MENLPPKLQVRFFCTASGNEPVREWLTEQDKEVRHLVGTDVKTVQFGWPIGMPVVRKLEDGLWEVRTHIPGGIVRTLFTVVESYMVILHAFIKKSQKTPSADLAIAKNRKAALRGNP